MKLKTGSIVVTRDVCNWPLYMIIGQSDSSLDPVSGCQFVAVPVHVEIDGDSSSSVTAEISIAQTITQLDIAVVVGGNKNFNDDNYHDTIYRLSKMLDSMKEDPDAIASRIEINNSMRLESDCAVTQTFNQIISSRSSCGKWLYDLVNRDISYEAASNILAALEDAKFNKQYEDFGIDRYMMMQIMSRIKKVIRENKSGDQTKEDPNESKG